MPYVPPVASRLSSDVSPVSKDFCPVRCDVCLVTRDLSLVSCDIFLSNILGVMFCQVKVVLDIYLEILMMVDNLEED